MVGSDGVRSVISEWVAGGAAADAFEVRIPDNAPESLAAVDEAVNDIQRARDFGHHPL